MKLKLVSVKPEIKDVRSFFFEAETPQEWKPGQYMHYFLQHPHEDDRGIERWFTISNAPFETQVRITTRFSEKSSTFKQALSKLNVGDQIEAEGPGGKFVMAEGDVHHIFIAGGIGITPFRSMLAQLDHDGAKMDIELLYANRDEELVFGDELKAIEAKNDGFKIRTFIGEKRIVEEDMKPYISEPRNIFYVSGPEPMVEDFKKMLEGLGASEERIKTDYFPGYEDA